MSLTSEHSISPRGAKPNSSPLLRDSLRLAEKIEHIHGHPVGLPNSPHPVEDFTVPATSTHIEIMKPDSSEEVIEVTGAFREKDDHLNRTQRIALGARALAGSLIERLGSPTAPSHRKRRIGLTGLQAFGSTGGSHKLQAGKHRRSTAKHRA